MLSAMLDKLIKECQCLTHMNFQETQKGELEMLVKPLVPINEDEIKTSYGDEYKKLSSNQGPNFHFLIIFINNMLGHFWSISRY